MSTIIPESSYELSESSSSDKSLSLSIISQEIVRLIIHVPNKNNKIQIQTLSSISTFLLRVSEYAISGAIKGWFIDDHEEYEGEDLKPFNKTPLNDGFMGSFTRTPIPYDPSIPIFEIRSRWPKY